MKSEKLIIIGTSTTAKHVYEFVRMYNLYDIIGFAVNDKYKSSETLCGLPVYSLENLSSEVDEDFNVFVAVLWNHLNRDRKDLYDYCKSKGYKMVNIISPNAIIRGNLLGDNCWVHDYVVIQNNADLDSDIAIMAYSLIGADTHVCSHCFFGAKSILGGGSTIGEQSFVGLNAVIFDDTHIGKKCIIGACTTVKRNIPDFSKYVTTSDDIVIKQYSEGEIEDKLMFSKNIR
jgi:sugar O-acyltransferase (sialic acid O-acetyltransferase NeuD family)